MYFIRIFKGNQAYLICRERGPAPPLLPLQRDPRLRLQVRVLLAQGLVLDWRNKEITGKTDVSTLKKLAVSGAR